MPCQPRGTGEARTQARRTVHLELIREALGQRVKDASQRRSGRDFYGFTPIPAGGAVVTDQLVNKLRDELGV